MRPLPPRELQAQVSHEPGAATRYRLLLLLMLVLFLVILAYGVTGALLIEAFQDRSLRCYPIVPPLMQHERAILEGERFICSSALCRLVGRVLHNNGLVCFFPPPQLLKPS